jgi:hypothetical protein
VVRARRTQGADDDTVVKLRPAEPRSLSPAVRDSKNLTVEMDVTRGSYVVSASLKGSRRAGAVREAVTGGRPLERLFTMEQRSFFDEHAPAEVELSTKATPQTVPLLADRVRFVREHGLSATGAQEPKTRKALEFFARATPALVSPG